MWNWFLKESIIKFEPTPDGTKFELGLVWITVIAIKVGILIYRWSQVLLVDYNG